MEYYVLLRNIHYEGYEVLIGAKTLEELHKRTENLPDYPRDYITVEGLDESGRLREIGECNYIDGTHTFNLHPSYKDTLKQEQP